MEGSKTAPMAVLRENYGAELHKSFSFYTELEKVRKKKSFHFKVIFYVHVVFSADSVNIQSPSQNISSYKTVSFIFARHDPSPFYGRLNLGVSVP